MGGGNGWAAKQGVPPTGSFEVPRECGIAGLRRALNSFSYLTVEASSSPACTYTHLLGTGGTNPGRGR